ncbi:phasin family protein [Emcibacter sp. SYSU 3D8]|uniref:phasin family protein n=1 Tax=Emcibacter sp. SYSU 3D8 TaxID=3133969 RepID=UPI0031FEA79C
MASKNSSTPANPFADWYENVQKMVGGTLPAVDLKSLTEAGQGNMKAMGDVAKIAANALQDIVKQQQAIATQAVAEWQDTAGKLARGEGQALMTGSLDTFRTKAEEAAKNFGDLSEIARKAQTDIWGVLTTQFEKNTGKK